VLAEVLQDDEREAQQAVLGDLQLLLAHVRLLQVVEMNKHVAHVVFFDFNYDPTQEPVVFALVKELQVAAVTVLVLFVQSLEALLGLLLSLRTPALTDALVGLVRVNKIIAQAAVQRGLLQQHVLHESRLLQVLIFDVLDQLGDVQVSDFVHGGARPGIVCAFVPHLPQRLHFVVHDLVGVVKACFLHGLVCNNNGLLWCSLWSFRIFSKSTGGL